MKRYPMLSNWVTIKDYRFGNVLITNELTGKSYTADQKCLAFLKMLDGKTNPYAMSYPYEMGWSRADVEAMLDEFTKFGLIRKNMVYAKSLLALYRTVYIPRNHSSGSVLYKLLNTFLWMSFLPVFVIGCIVFWSEFTDPGLNGFIAGGILPGLIAGFLSGCVLHEAGHAVAALASGGKVFEFGIHFNIWIIPGAYALVKEKDSASRIQKMQIYAAGVEANLLIAGLALIILACSHQHAAFFLSAAAVNVFLFLENLIFRDGIDGCFVFSQMFGLDQSIVGAAWDMLFTKDKRERLMLHGCHGKAAFCTYCLIILIQITGFVVSTAALANLLDVSFRK